MRGYTEALAHLALRTEGLCDPTTRVERPPELQRLDVFCNAAAAACLMPADAVREHDDVRMHGRGSPEWANVTVERLARDFAVSREPIPRRLGQNIQRCSAAKALSSTMRVRLCYRSRHAAQDSSAEYHRCKRCACDK